MTQINYEKISGNLPPNITLSNDGKYGRFSGTVGWLDGTAPVWNQSVSSDLGSWLTEEPISISGFDVSPYIGRTITDFQVVGNTGKKYSSIPFGIWLDSSTGILHGAAIDTGGDYMENPWRLSEQPIWDAYPTNPIDVPADQIADWCVNDAVTTTIHATPQLGASMTEYGVIWGSLPWGTTLNPTTGVISGTISRMAAIGSPLESETPKPSWGNIAGSLGNFAESQAVSIQLNATALLGTAMDNWDIISGYLPWGLTLNSSSGLISGTAAPVIGDGEFISITPFPTWNTPEGSLGNYDELSSLSISLSSTANLGNTITTWEIIRGALPWGTTLNTTTGVISGTVADQLINPTEPQYIYPGPNWVTASDLGTVTLNSTSTITLVATPSDGRNIASYYIPYTLTKGLPNGIWLNSASGALTGTFKESGSFTFTVIVGDTTGAMSTKVFSLLVA